MKRKWFAVLMVLCVMMFMVKPLTVSAARSLDATDKESSNDLSDLDDPWGSINDYGFANNMMIVMSLYDGIDEEYQVSNLLDNLHILSASLEPEQFYRVTLDFMCNIDQTHPEMYDDINLQIRFPATLATGSPNAIGFSVNGSQIDTWYDTFGIDCNEDLDLYYLEGSGEVDMMGDDIGEFINGAEDKLFASAEGLPIGSLFDTIMDNLVEIDGYKIAFFQVRFTLYAAPHEGAMYRDDLAINYWEGQKLMSAYKVTPAPEASYYVATLGKDGNVVIPVDKTGDQSESVPWKIVWCIIILIVGLSIFLVYKVRKNAHERGITGFTNIFNDFMKLTDDDE